MLILLATWASSMRYIKAYNVVWSYLPLLHFSLFPFPQAFSCSAWSPEVWSGSHTPSHRVLRSYLQWHHLSVDLSLCGAHQLPLYLNIEAEWYAAASFEVAFQNAFSLSMCSTLKPLTILGQLFLLF